MSKYKKILSIFVFTILGAIVFVLRTPVQVQAAVTCPYFDGGIGDDDSTVNGIITISSNRTLSADNAQADNGEFDCSSLDFHITNNAIFTFDPFVDTDAESSDDFGVTLMLKSIEIDEFSAISANAIGYLGGVASMESGDGPGGGSVGSGYRGAGGGHGGVGGYTTGIGGISYGSMTNPIMLGSGGASGSFSNGDGGNGGAAIKIIASGSITNNGTISANGQNGKGSNCEPGGGGGGGSVYLATSTLVGSGIISADGGDGNSTCSAGGGGAGGRILVTYSAEDLFTGTYSAKGGLYGGVTNPLAEDGTVLILDSINNDLIIPSGEQMWSADSSLEGSSHTYNSVTVKTGANLQLKGYYTTDTDDEGFSFTVSDFTVESGATIFGDGLGFRAALFQNQGDGPGGGGTLGSSVGGGAGYGGLGAVGGAGAAGPTYGSFLYPTNLGSGGGAGNSKGGNGGSAIHVAASGTIIINGDISMDGINGSGSNCEVGAGGSGGSIYFSGQTISGSGTISANGGNGVNICGDSGGGGGGRIAMYHVLSNTLIGSAAVNHGLYGSTTAEDGTISTGGFPGLPTELFQYQADGLTEIIIGDAVNSDSIIIKFSANDGDSSDTLRAEIEIQELEIDFSNFPIATGSGVAKTNSAVEVSATVSGLNDMTNYHWQGRVCDSTNRCSQWQSYGGNAESETDFTVVLNATPNNPTIPGSSTFIDGQRTNDTTPTFLFSQSDPDTGNQVKYQIQVDNNSDFSSVLVDYTSALAAQGSTSFTVGQNEGSGTYTTGTAGQTLSEASLYWRIKTIDENDGESSWVAATGTPAFVIDTTSPTNAITTSMKAYAAHATTHTDDSSVVWFSREDMYFSWSTAGDTSGLKGYCVYLGTDLDGDPSSQKGLLGTSPVSTTGSNCQFITDSTSLDFSNTALRGSTWLSSSSDPYYFKIRPIDTANNAGQNDSDSSTFSFYFDGTAPNNVSTISASSGSLSSIADMNFYWPTSGAQAATDAGSGILGYQYAVNSTDTWRGTLTDNTTGYEYIATNSAQPFTLDSAVVGDDIIVGSNVLYFRTVDKAGNTSTYTTAPLEYGGEAPSFDNEDVVTVTPTTNTENSFAFSWPEATPSDGRTVSTYYYMVNTAPPALYQTITSNSATYVPSTSTSIAATSLTNVRKGSNTIYVVAVDDNDNYSQSNYIYGNFTLNSTLPDSPQSLVASDASVKTASLWRTSLAWSAPDYKGTGDLTYTIQRSNDAETWSDIDTTSGLAFLDTLSASDLYYWRVAATDSSDESIASPSYSSAVSLTPKGAFTEAAELTSGPAASSITTKRATITWTTARGSDSKISLGIKSGDYEDEETSNSTQVSDHTINLINLNPGTTYYYKAKWTDEDGNTGESEEKSFITDPAPVVKDVVIKNIGVDSALVEFTTVGASSANINYGKSTSFGGIETISTSTVETTYAVQLSELDDGTKYYFKIDTKDSEGDLYDGTILDFETLPRPEVSNVRVQQVANTAQSSIQVTWESNTAISSIVTFYPESNPEYARDAVDIELLDGEHEMIVPGLLPETSYILIVKGRDRIGNEAVSDNLRFTTATDTRPPRMTDLVVEGTNIPQVSSTAQESNSQLVVTWTTDEPSTSQVEYGDGTGISYSQVTQEDQTLTYNHLVIVSGLTPSKVYHLRAISRDTAGNASQSVDTVTITPKATDNAFDLVITNLREVFGFLGNI